MTSYGVASQRFLLVPRPRPYPPQESKTPVQLGSCPPPDRIALREPVLAFGLAAIDPLADLAARRPDLAASVAAWLEALAKRAPETKPAAVKALARLTREPDGHIAREALSRLGGRPQTGTKPVRDRAPERSAAETEVHARLILAAREGQILTYAELETNRGHVGRFLHNISVAEADLGHPPLAAIVVSKSTGLPGDGFLEAMTDVGFPDRGEPVEVVWKRAVAEVHAFWASQEPTPEPLKS